MYLLLIALLIVAAIAFYGGKAGLLVKKGQRAKPSDRESLFSKQTH